MKNYLIGLLRPPVFEDDEEKSRIIRLLYLITEGLALAAIIGA
jgi:hypothetical protein